MKTIICDQFGLHTAGSTDLVVEDESQYAAALEHFSARPNASDGCVVVKNPALFHWFDAPAKRFGCNIIRLDPVAALKKQLHRSTLPHPLQEHPEWIIELNLLERATVTPIHSQESGKAWLQRVLLGEFWQPQQPMEQLDLTALLVWLARHHESELHPLARQLLTAQIQTWMDCDSPFVEILRWLAAAPFRRARIVIWHQVLRDYPSHRVANWFQYESDWHTCTFLISGSSYLKPVEAPVPLPEGVGVFLQNFLEEEWQKSPLQALNYVSGKLEAEQRFLRQTLLSQLQQGIPLDATVYQKICQIQAVPEAAELAALLIPAQEPEPLSPQADVKTVQQWLQNAYLPFYNACVRLQQIERTLPWVTQFEAWLDQNYSKLLIDGTGMAYRQIGRLKSKLQDGPVLLYVFDGLDYLGGKDALLPVLEKAGARSETEVAPCLTCLPSETSIAKPPLVCGWMNSQLPLEQPDAKFYHQLITSALGLDETDVLSATDQDRSLLELIQRPARVYLYLDNHLDREYLHAALNNYTRQKKYREYVYQQAQVIVEAVLAIKDFQGMFPSLVICSDHGYTELPPTVSTIALESAKKYRSRSMFTTDSHLVSAADADLIWQLKAGLYGLHAEMAVPRGYGCFGKRPRGATHGGCTPQEIAVPWFMVSFQKAAAPSPPQVSIEGQIFRRRKSNPLQIYFSNPNPYSLTVAEVAIDGIIITSVLPLHLSAHQASCIEGDFDAAAINTNDITFHGTVRVTHQYGRETIPISLTVSTYGAMRDDFDDDFEV